MAKVLKEELFNTLPAVQVNEEEITKELLKELQEFHKKIVVLDDDPQGPRQYTTYLYTRNGRKMP